jgi:P-type Ca2+ transporter type 2C
VSDPPHTPPGGPPSGLPTEPWALEPAVVAEQLGVDPTRGLTSPEVQARLERHGPNSLRRVERKSAAEILLNQGKSLIVALLLAAGLVSAAFGEWIEAGAIAAVLVINTLIGFLTELRAVRSMEALRDLGQVQARVLRGGQEMEVPAQDLVPGDVVILEGGDVVTADLRLVEASKLEVDESVLTGESLPVEKSPAAVPAGTPLADRRDMLHKGTALTRGSATALVASTGMATELGKIAALVAEAGDEPTPLEQRLERLGRRLIVVAMGIAGAATVGGILSGKDVYLMVETGIALSVAAIPEGLPVVATMALARGMWRLARRNALIRELSAVETLGATSIILTDKTGTLTENRMTVTQVVLADAGVVEVSGEGLQLQGSFTSGGTELSTGAGPLREALELCALCNNASLPEPGGEGLGLGDPLEVALLVAAAKAGIERKRLLELEPELQEEAFDPALKMMATLHQSSSGVRIAVKGAAEAVLEASTSEAGAAGALAPERRTWWLEQNAALAARGLRVLALATRAVASAPSSLYEELTFVGLVAMQDPPRAGVKDTVAACRRAGVRVVMATGDQPATALTIARAVGLGDDDQSQVVAGPELQAALAQPERLARTAVFARVDPAQKLELVKAFQRTGAIVAMTGDGVNDAPALKQAEIGVAMGLRGTQVAREAADMVLRDDSLDSIVVAVRQGRVIFENIRQFVLYLLSCNVSEIGVIAVASLLGLPLPLLPLQILFLNLVTDVFPALALGFGEGDPGTMERSPRDPQEPFLARRHWVEIGAHAAVITACVLGALLVALGPLGYQAPAAISISFLTLGFAQLWHVFNARNPGSSFLGNDVVRNPHVWGAIGLCTVLLLATAWIAPLAKLLAVVPPDLQGWAVVLGFSLVPWVLGQASHALRSSSAA